MLNGQQTRNRALSRDPQFSYLPEDDRYLLDKPQPGHRFNVIGTGLNGQEHIRVTHLEGRATIHGVYDPNPSSLTGACQVNAQYHPGSNLVLYNSLEAACNDPLVDGLIICTPNYTHLDVVRVAVQSGKNILLEKPLATTLQDAVTITEIAEEYPAVFQVGLQYRYKAMYSEAIYEALTRRVLGNVKLMSIQEHRIPFLDKVNQWNKFVKYSGNSLVEKCCHYFDLLNLFAQSRPQSVYASGGSSVNFKVFDYHGEKSDVMDNATVIVNYENGVRATFTLCMFAPTIYEELIICGDAGWLKAWERQESLTTPELQTELEILCGDHQPSRKMRPGYPAWIERSGHNGATFYEHTHFINQIEGLESNAATAREGLWSVIVALAAQESIIRGEMVLIQELLSDKAGV